MALPKKLTGPLAVPVMLTDSLAMPPSTELSIWVWMIFVSSAVETLLLSA